MRKFAKISAYIVIVIFSFILANTIVFKDRVSVQDYNKSNPITTIASIEKYEKTNDGVIVNIKIKNNSNYTYKLDNASIVFFSCERDSNDNIIGSREAFKLNILPMDIQNEEDDIRWSGIGPKKEGYIEFLYPKGIKMDDRFFDLDETTLKYNGSFTENLSIGDGAYTTITVEDKEENINDLDNKIIQKLRGE